MWRSPKDSPLKVPECPGWFIAKVPGDVHSDLAAAGLLEEPLKSDNALKQRWVEWAQFRFRRTFSSPSAKGFDRAELVFEGLDLTAEVILDGQVCGHHANAFRPLRLDVTKFLREGNQHTLEVQLDSGLAATRGKPLGRYWDFCKPPAPERIFLRKPQFSFGWDWAPRLVTCGIWRPVSLHLIHKACLRNVCLRSRLSGSTAHVAVSVEVENVTESVLPALIHISLERRSGFHAESIAVSLPPGSSVFHLSLLIPDADLWWPRPLGEPSLYEVEAVLSVEGEAVDKQVFRYGIREVSLAQRPLDEGGTDFVFHVNGEPVFCKGANWVPADSLPSRVTEKKYRRLLQMAVHSEFNMLRVWGGGIYEAPLFYDLCDQLGVLVWQDFMLACAEYPDDAPAFPAEFEAEARHVIRRLRNHPCLALWCGDNECDWLFENRTAEAGERKSGRMLTHDLLPRLLAELDPTRPYWPSSPQGGPEPNSPLAGDRHIWEVSIKSSNPEGRVGFARYQEDRCRFASEYGFLAPTVRASLEEYLPPDQRMPGSKVYSFHNNTIAAANVSLSLKRYFGEEPENVDEYLLKAQVLQAEALRTAIEHHRRQKWLCAGSLFWMYADCWGTSGWSIVDYYLRRKPSAFVVRRAFAPVALALLPSQGKIQVWGINDLPTEVTGILRAGLGRFCCPEQEMLRKPIVLAANSSRLIGVLSESPPDREMVESYAWAEFHEEGKLLVESVQLFVAPKYLLLPTARPRLEVLKQTPGRVRIRLCSPEFAWYVWLELPDGVEASDNAFHLRPNFPKEVILAGNSDRVDLEPVTLSAVNIPRMSLNRMLV